MTQTSIINFILATEPDMPDDDVVEFLAWLECHGGTDDRELGQWTFALARWRASKAPSPTQPQAA